jgi:manganese transport protein
MVFSQAFQACILPAVVAPIFFLINRESLMGKHRAKLQTNVGIFAVFLFSLVTTWFAITELL